MIAISQNTIDGLTAPVRHIKGYVRHLRAGTQEAIYNYNGALQEIEVQRTLEQGKFFGACCCQRLHIKLMDLNRTISVIAGDELRAYIYLDDSSIPVYFPPFLVSEVNRDEKTNQLLITAYDAMNTLKEKTFADIKNYFDENTGGAYSMVDVVSKIAEKLGLTSSGYTFRNFATGDTRKNNSYPTGANYDGNETLWEILEDICEALQCVAFLNNSTLILKSIRYNESNSLTISKAQILELDSKTNRRLIGICSATSLEDNVESKLAIEGTTQYCYDNGFLTALSNLGAYLDTSLSYTAGTGGLSINQFDLKWRGWLGLEIGDLITFTCKDNTTATSYIFDDTITYDGTLKEETKFSFGEQEDREANPSSLGEALNRTFAKVDKAEQNITMLVNSTETNSDNIAQLRLDNESIQANVRQISNTTNAAVDNLTGQIQTITNELDTKVDASQVAILISNTIERGEIDSITTSTGFTFNQDGLTVSKNDSQMKTLIDEDGMTISRNTEDVLQVNNTGVIAENITLSRYLTIGLNSRIEDYVDSNNNNATAIYWVGG